MANIFKSKEVYKHVIKPGDIHQLIPVSGVYVANQRRTPFYIDHTISIVGIGTTPANVVTYVETDVDVYGPYEIQNPSMVITNGNVTIETYSKRSVDVYGPYEIPTPSITIANDTINIYEYTRDTAIVYDNFEIHNCTFTCTNNTINAASIITTHNSEIDGFLQITNISSNEATIT